MSRRADLLEPLKLPALVLAGVLLAAVLLLYGSGRFSNAMADAHSELERRLTDANIRLQRLRGQHANLQTDATAFARLAEHGLAGPEQRLALVHLMQVLPGETGVDQAVYQLAAQRAYARLPSDGGAPLNLSASAMTLQLTAAHEGRVLNFLSALQARIPGLLVARECSIESARGPVHATCRLDWITLDP